MGQAPNARRSAWPRYPESKTTPFEYRGQLFWVFDVCESILFAEMRTSPPKCRRASAPRGWPASNAASASRHRTAARRADYLQKLIYCGDTQWAPGATIKIVLTLTATAAGTDNFTVYARGTGSDDVRQREPD